jgi:hypothetical protein
MVGNDAKYAFDRRLYVDRRITDQVIDTCRTWAGTTDRLCWISLSTASGRGNTWLLQGLAEKITGTNLLLQPMIIDAVREGGAPPEFTPLQEVLTGRRRRGSFFRRALHRFRTAASMRPLIFVGAVIVLFGVALLAHSANEYVDDAKNASVAHFFQHYLMAHWREGIFKVLISVVFSLSSWILMRFLIHDGSRDDELSEAEKKQYLTPDGLAGGLAEFARNRAGVALLVDRAHLLPAQDRALLLDLQRRTPENESIRRLREQYRFIIVTVDEAPAFAAVDNAKKGSAQPRVDPVVALPVPDEFTQDELLEIARRQRPDIYGRLTDDTDDEARTLLDEAAVNIHALMDDNTGSAGITGERLFTEAEARNTDGVSFGPESMLLYQAVRMVGGVERPRCEKKALSDWLRELLRSRHLERFGVPVLASEKDLLDDLREQSGVVRSSGSILSFDATLCRAVVQWARENRAKVAARAYYYWLRELLRRASVPVDTLAGAMPSQTKRHALKKAAWFAMEITELDIEVSDFLEPLSPDGRIEVRSDAVRALLAASIVYAREGDTQQAGSAIEDLVEWLDAELAAADPALAEAAAAHAWELYWLTADDAVYSMLVKLGELVPTLKDRQPWRIEARFDDVARGRAAEPWRKSAKRAMAPALINRGSLAETWRRARGGARGFVFPFDYPEAPREEVEVPQFPSSTATTLRHMAVASARDLVKAETIIDAWTASLPPQVDSGCVGDEVLLVNQQAAIAHLRVRMAISAGDAEARERHADVAATAYDRALLLSSLIGWRGLTAELSFHFGRLMYGLSLVRRDEEWDTWEAAFSNTVTIEREAGWMLYTPEVHFIRWLFFRGLAIERSLEDGYNVYETARALVSLPVFLEHCRTIMIDFNNGARSASDPVRAHDRSAMLWTEWADSLAALPEAREFWTPSFTRLEAEQADSLGYAAQARRLADQPEAAEALLDRADALLGQLDADDPVRRSIALAVRYQRVMLVENDLPKRDVAGRALWTEVRFEDEMFPLALGLMVNADARAETLADPWPRDDSGALAADPDSPAVSLEPGWLAARAIVPPRNRFEYRFRQFQRGFDLSPASDYTHQMSMLADIAISDNFIEPIRRDLLVLLARCIALTRAVRAESTEIDLLRLLLTATNNDANVHAEYVSAIARFERLFERERKMVSEGPLGWYALAERLHHYFHMLVNDELLNAEYLAAMQSARVDPNAGLEERKERQKLYEGARRAHDGGSLADCVAILDDALPPANAHWVFWEDLLALQLWFEAASVVVNAPQLTDRAQQLRAFTMRYVRQLSITVEDAQIRLIALKLLKFLEEGMTAAARLPIAGEPDVKTQGSGRRQRPRPTAA